MIGRRFAAALVLAPAGLGAGLPPGDPACDRAMPAYERDWLAPARGGGRLALAAAGGGELLYLAVRHTSDPADRQLADLERELRHFRPTLVLYEGESAAVGRDRRDSARRYGEAGFLRFVARELGVPARSFDAGAAELIGFLAQRFAPEEVKIHFVLREIWLLRDRRGASGRELRQAAGAIIRGELLPQLPRVLMTEREFARAFSDRWPPTARWTEPRAEWFDPYGAGRGGAGFTNRLEQAATVFRDLHMYRTLAREVGAGERVFAVAGGGHLPVQEPALRCALER